MKDPIKELERIVEMCGGTPEVFSLQDIAEAKAMGIVIEPTNPGRDAFLREMGIKFN